MFCLVDGKAAISAEFVTDAEVEPGGRHSMFKAAHQLCV